MLHVIMGTKGQFIKMLPILKELDKRRIPYNFIDAAQHVDITKKLIMQFNFKKPDYVLDNLNKDITNVFQITWWLSKNSFKTIFKKKEIFKTKVGYCLLQGDAPPALLGLIMCKLAGIKIIHIEAGERTHNIFNPFPEELIRRIVDRFSDIMFVESSDNYKNLLKEKIKGKVYIIGFNTVLDSVRIALKNQKKFNQKPYVLVSIHRFETITSKKRLNFVVNIIQEVSKCHHVIFPLHESTKNYLNKFNLLPKLKNNKHIKLLPIQDYFSFINLINNSIFMVTDGGGPQQETYILNKPCLLLRKVNEKNHPNIFVAGFNFNKVNYFLKNYKSFKSNFNFKESPSKKIVDILEKQPSLMSKTPL